MSIVDNLRNFVARKPSPPICFSSIPPHELISVTCYEFSPKDTEGSDLPKFVMRSRLELKSSDDTIIYSLPDNLKQRIATAVSEGKLNGKKKKKASSDDIYKLSDVRAEIQKQKGETNAHSPFDTENSMSIKETSATKSSLTKVADFDIYGNLLGAPVEKYDPSKSLTSPPTDIVIGDMFKLPTTPQPSITAPEISRNSTEPKEIDCSHSTVHTVSSKATVGLFDDLPAESKKKIDRSSSKNDRKSSHSSFDNSNNSFSGNNDRNMTKMMGTNLIHRSVFDLIGAEGDQQNPSKKLKTNPQGDSLSLYKDGSSYDQSFMTHGIELYESDEEGQSDPKKRSFRSSNQHPDDQKILSKYMQDTPGDRSSSSSSSSGGGGSDKKNFSNRLPPSGLNRAARRALGVKK